MGKNVMKNKSRFTTKPERNGWRDSELSRRHRKWGLNCPAVDIDFLLVEYNHEKPVALVEYKNINANIPNHFNHPTYKALSYLADNHKPRPLPFFIAIYDSNHWWFIIKPINEKSKKLLSFVEGKKISEQYFVKILYRLRKRFLEEEELKLINQLNNVVPSN